MQETQQEPWVQYLGGEDPLEKEMQPTSVFLPRKSMDRETWRATYSPWILKKVRHNLATKQTTYIYVYSYYICNYKLHMCFTIVQSNINT